MIEFDSKTVASGPSSPTFVRAVADPVDREILARMRSPVALIPELDHDGASVEARGNQGVTVRMDMPPGKSGPQPVLFLTRRGEVVATLVDPAEPFPGYHGQGGRLRRPGDTMPHVSPVLELAVVTHR